MNNLQKNKMNSMSMKTEKVFVLDTQISLNGL